MSVRRFVRLALVPAVAGSLVLGLATSASARSVRLDVSNNGWVGYAEVETTKRGGTTHLYGTLHKVKRSGCLILEADNGRLSFGSQRLVKRCKPGTSRVNVSTSRDRLVLRSPKSWAPDATSTEAL
ncbi:hypothetical protein AB0C93_37910 [Streptomyces sp. NPDC048518]|uniref:hypothetical protein n=1 Tax=Streptomyces sp. NPDC048518 TaxID=3155029 RepID=UPI0034092380